MAFVKVTSTTDLTSTNDAGAKTVAVMFIRDPATPTSTIVANNIVAVFAQETFHFLATEPTGQGQQTLVTAVHGATDTDSNLANNSKVTRGMNINTAFTDATVNNASDSTKLGGQLPAYYLDHTNFTNTAAAPFVALNANTIPDTDNSYTVGSGAAKFANIHSTTFTGALAGNAATATTSTQLNGQVATYYLSLIHI